MVIASKEPEANKLYLNIAPYGADENGNPHPPNPTQQYVLDWVDEQRELQAQRAACAEDQGEGIPVLYLQGGVGSGKTRAFLAATLELLFEITGLRALWGRLDFNDLRTSAMEDFEEVLPPEMIAGKNVQEHLYKIHQVDETGITDTVGKIFFRGLKDLSGLGSQQFGLIVITEVHETSLKMYRTLKMRCRQAGKPIMILMEGNPPNKGHWLDNVTDETHEDYDPDIEMIELSTYENWENLPGPYKASLEKLPKSWRDKYLHGHFGFMPDGKPFYSGFDEDMHCADLEWIEGKELLVGWDFGFHHPACVVSQIDEFDRWGILMEIMGRDVSLEKFID